MSARDSVDTLFHSKTSLCSVSLTTRPRRHWGLKSAKGDSRSLRSRESPPNLNIKGTSWTSVKTWITAGGPLVQVGSAPVHLVPSKKLDRPSSIGGCRYRYDDLHETLASLAVQHRVFARKRVLSLDEIWHPFLNRFVEKRVRGGPRFQNSFRDRRLFVFIQEEERLFFKDRFLK